MITGDLKSKIDKLWETFWTGGISNPLTVIEQITYLLFIKRMDDLQILKENKANRLGIPIEDPIYTAAERPLRWSSFKQKDPEELLDLFRKPLSKEMDYTAFDKMKLMGAEDSPFRTFMKGATFMVDKARLLDKAVQMLEEIDQADQDTKGDLYEYLLSKIASAGQNGQFRTPRHIIQMMVEMVKPTLHDTVCDPSAGTMGFLVATTEYMKKHYADDLLRPEHKAHYQKKMFNGIEFDPSMIRIGAMNMTLHGLDSPNLILEDSLSEKAAYIKDVYSLILANPPFKGSLDADAVDSTILKMVKSKKTELLFLGAMLRMMTTGGRAAVIVPDGVLFGSSKAHKQIRKEIIEQQQLQAVISMPSGVFKPYAGVSTAILFFTKTESGGTDKVWFYDMKADGRSLDDKRNILGSTNDAGELTQSHEENNMPDIITRWNSSDFELVESKRKRTEQSFFVPLKEIQDNGYDLSINRYKEIVYEKIEYDKPAVIMERIREQDEKRKGLLTKLEKMLAK